MKKGTKIAIVVIVAVILLVVGFNYLYEQTEKRAAEEAIKSYVVSTEKEITEYVAADIAKDEIIKQITDTMNESWSEDGITAVYQYYVENATGIRVNYDIYKDKKLYGNIDVTFKDWTCTDPQFLTNWRND